MCKCLDFYYFMQFLGLVKTIWWHLFWACLLKGATIDDKVYVSLSSTFIKVVQASIQKCITYPKKLDKDKQAWIELALSLDCGPKNSTHWWKQGKFFLSSFQPFVKYFLSLSSFFIDWFLGLCNKIDFCKFHEFVKNNSIVDDRFASQVLFFQDALTFRNAITLCYRWQFIWHCKLVYHLQGYGFCVRQWQNSYPQLSLVKFCQGH
jgi:hypothetical protein